MDEYSWVPVNYAYTVYPCHFSFQETTHPMQENQTAFVASPLHVRQAGPGGVQASLLNSDSSHSEDGFGGGKMLVWHMQRLWVWTFTLRKYTGSARPP